MGLADYLPVAAAVAIVAAALVFGILIARERRRERKGVSVCIYCKALAPKISHKTYLFLIPVFFRQTYADAENYLRSNMKPILGTEQIPTGMRACFVEVHQCPRCDRRHVVVKDFLRVRGESHTVGKYRFSFESFRPLLDAWEQAGGERHGGGLGENEDGRTGHVRFL